MADIFVSYGRKDGPYVKRLVTQLQGRGFTVWLDAQLVTGSAFARVIETEIRQSQLALVVWSKTSVRSEWVYAEAELARRLGKLRQIVLDDAEPPIPFGALHYEQGSRQADEAQMDALLDEVFGLHPENAADAPARLAASRFLFKKMAPELLLSCLGFIGVGASIAFAMTDRVDASIIAPLLYGVIGIAVSSGIFTAVRLVSLERLGR